MNDKIMVKRDIVIIGGSPGCKERGSREYPDPGT